MRVSYHPDYRVDLGPSHPYPMGKYPLLYELLLSRGLIRACDVMEPVEAPLSMLERVHDGDYLAKLRDGSLTPQELRTLGLRWSPRLWRRSRLVAHGTYLAALAALEEGLSANLAGGTHHAHAGHGEGFCVLNDVAIAIEALRVERRDWRFLVVDLDVHQGNGTAEIYAGDESVYTLSVHAERNYPTRKAVSSRDVGLPDGTGDEGYLAALAAALPPALAESRADLAFYLAGVDVLANDRYGRLALTRDGLRRRERLVLAAMRRAGLPLVITLAGGYAATPLLTADHHSEVFAAAAEQDAVARVNLRGGHVPGSSDQ